MSFQTALSIQFHILMDTPGCVHHLGRLTISRRLRHSQERGLNTPKEYIIGLRGGLHLIPNPLPTQVPVHVLSCRLQTLGNMQASDELDPSQIRQLSHELDSAYASFNNFLHSQ